MDKLIEWAPLLMKGALVTVTLAILSLILATLLGGLGAWGKLSGSAIARAVASIYTTIVRGVPDLVLILLIYFGGQRMVNAIAGWFGADGIELSKFWAGVLSIGFIYGAYLTETFRGAYATVPKGQREAARSLGLGRFVTFWKVLAPQIARFALPGYANVWMVLVKSTAVVSVIGLDDLVGLADKAAKSTREPFTFFFAVILVYLLITAVSNWALSKVDARANSGDGVMDFGLVLKHWDMFAEGVWMTLQLTFLSVALGFVLALPMALALYRKAPVSPLIRGFVYVFRGTPLLVQLYLIYYGLSQFGWIRASFLWPWLREAYWCALLAFTLNSAAYQTEILRGALTTTPKGEIEGAMALGLSKRQVTWLALLPSALRRALPQMSNEVVFMLHGSVVASVITIQDILGAGRTLNAKYYVAYEGFITAALLYMAITFTLIGIFRLFERRYLRHLQSVSAVSTKKRKNPVVEAATGIR